MISGLSPVLLHLVYDFHVCFLLMNDYATDHSTEELPNIHIY